MLHDQKYAEGKTILIVEDDEAVGTFLEQAIATETPYRAVVVNDGFEALKVTHDIKPNLMILDYNLPGMNGIELYDQLHASKELEQITAIMISAALPRPDIKKRSLIGVQKPFDLSDLLLTVIEVLGD